MVAWLYVQRFFFSQKMILVIIALGMVRTPLWSGQGFFRTLLGPIWGPLSIVRTLYHVLTFGIPCILVKGSKKINSNAIWCSVKKWRTACSDQSNMTPVLDGSIEFSAKYQLNQIRAALNRSHFIPTLFLIFLPPSSSSFSKVRPNSRSLFIHCMKLDEIGWN